MSRVRHAVSLLGSQNGNLGAFMEQDPRGRALPGFLTKLADHFEAENGKLQDEALKLVQHVEHIKEIVSTQQSYARVMGVIERTTVMDRVDSAMRLCRESVTKHQVELSRDIEPALPLVSVDRHKVVQVLVNLLSNDSPDAS